MRNPGEPKYPAQLIAESNEAKQIMEGPVFREAFANVRALFIREWEEADSQAQRELCWAKVSGLKEVQRQLRRSIRRGEHAAYIEGQASS